MKYADRFFPTKTFSFYHLAHLISNSSEFRIINFLKSLARDYGHEIKEMPAFKVIPIQFTSFEIARLTSTSHEKVKRVINDLKAKGLVKFSDDRLMLKF